MARRPGTGGRPEGLDLSYQAQVVTTHKGHQPRKSAFENVLIQTAIKQVVVHVSGQRDQLIKPPAPDTACIHSIESVKFTVITPVRARKPPSRHI